MTGLTDESADVCSLAAFSIYVKSHASEHFLSFSRNSHCKSFLIYIYIYIPLFCPGRVLMVDIFIIFRVQHYFRVQILAFSGQ